MALRLLPGRPQGGEVTTTRTLHTCTNREGAGIDLSCDGRCFYDDLVANGIALTLSCARCEATSRPFLDVDELTDELTREGWTVGGADFASFCPGCTWDYDERRARR